MVLTDPTGLVIDTQGDDRVIDAGRTVHLEHGGRWSEADIGTNAIGAAIAESKPVQIRGTEPRLSNLTIDGVTVPSPESGVRQIKLDTLASDLVESIERDLVRRNGCFTHTWKKGCSPDQGFAHLNAHAAVVSYKQRKDL